VEIEFPGRGVCPQEKNKVKIEFQEENLDPTK